MFVFYICHLVLNKNENCCFNYKKCFNLGIPKLIKDIECFEINNKAKILYIYIYIITFSMVF